MSETSSIPPTRPDDAMSIESGEILSQKSNNNETLESGQIIDDTINNFLDQTLTPAHESSSHSVDDNEEIICLDSVTEVNQLPKDKVEEFESNERQEKLSAWEMKYGSSQQILKNILKTGPSQHVKTTEIINLTEAPASKKSKSSKTERKKEKKARKKLEKRQEKARQAEEELKRLKSERIDFLSGLGNIDTGASSSTDPVEKLSNQSKRQRWIYFSEISDDKVQSRDLENANKRGVSNYIRRKELIGDSRGSGKNSSHKGKESSGQENSPTEEVICLTSDGEDLPPTPVRSETDDELEPVISDTVGKSGWQKLDVSVTDCSALEVTLVEENTCDSILGQVG